MAERPKTFGRIRGRVRLGKTTGITFTPDEAVKLATFLLNAAQTGKPSIELWARQRTDSEGLHTVSVNTRDLRVADD